MKIIDAHTLPLRVPAFVPAEFHKVSEWGTYPIAVASYHDSFNFMQPIYSTDYFAIIPHATVGGFVDPDKKSGTIRHLTNAAVADFATAALAAITVIMVVLVVFNWSR